MQFYDNFFEGMWKLWYVWVIIKNNTLYLYVSSVFNMEDKTHELILNLHKKEPTKVIHYSVAPIPQHQAIWRDMKEFTPVTKHSFAPSGTSNVQYQAIWRDMKEPTLVINHSAALRVTKKCSTSDTLKRLERNHSSDKSFSCSQCDCSISSHLTRHERIHTGDEPFSCSQSD